ncbi:hypothetical protein TNCV_567381 [Trichonephila clavipes]|nr:hypothetical protein TNCV_567381 [Trichonephila clavipes]
MDWQMMDYAKMMEQAKTMDGDEFARRLSAFKTDGIYRIGDQEVDISDLVNRMNSRRKQPEPKRIAVEPPPEETDTDKCRRHKEMQKRIKMTNGRLSYLEHCIRSEKEFPDLTDADALVKFQNEHDELSSQKEHILGELALCLPCPVLDCPENANYARKQNDPPESSAKKHSRPVNRENAKTKKKGDRGFVSPKKKKRLQKVKIFCSHSRDQSACNSAE